MSSNVYPPDRAPRCPIQGPKCLGVVRTKSAKACHSCSRAKPDRAVELPPPPDKQLPPPLLTFEREWKVWMNEIGMARDRYTGPAVAKARTGRLRILVIPDLHAPFHDSRAVASMLEREREIDIAVVMGDVGDSYALSRFLKYDRVPYEDELAAVTLLLQTFSERFPIVRLIEGNHDGPRVEKQLLERLSGDLVAAIRSMTGGTLSPVMALCRRFPNIEMVSPYADKHPLRWMTQIGDALFMHAEKYSRVPGSALRSIDEWVTDFEDAIGLGDYRVLVQAHTHQLAWIPWKANRLLIECGALCRSHGYQFAPKIGGRPQRTGWVVLEQVDGRTDINRSRIVWFDAEREDRNEPQG